MTNYNKNRWAWIIMAAAITTLILFALASLKGADAAPSAAAQQRTGYDELADWDNYFYDERY